MILASSDVLVSGGEGDCFSVLLTVIFGKASSIRGAGDTLLYLVDLSIDADYLHSAKLYGESSL